MDENIAIVALTESHLNSGYQEGEIKMSGSANFRADRKDGVNKRGVITYIREDIIAGANLLLSESVGNIEFIVLTLPSLDATLVVVYRPPAAESQHFRTAIDKINGSLSCNSEKLPRILFTGDLNFPSIDWSNLNVRACNTAVRHQASILLGFFQENFMEQLVHDPTRERNILDLVATNDLECVSDINVEDNDSKVSDHRSILIRTNFNCSKGSDNPRVDEGLNSLNFWHKNIDWPTVNDDFSNIDWNVALDGDDMDGMYNEFLNMLLKTCQKYIPVKVNRKNSIIPRDRRNLMRLRKKTRAKLLGTRNRDQIASIERKLIDIDKRLIRSHEDEARRTEERAVDKIKSDPKFFFNYARSKSQVRSPICPLIHNDSVITDPGETAEVLKSQFESVFSSPVDESFDFDTLASESGPRSVDDINFSLDDIKEAINSISPRSSPGNDGVSPILLRICSNSLSHPIYLIWRASMDTGKIPSSLKRSIVVPVFKNGSRAAAENYRPISLTSHVCKIF